MPFTETDTSSLASSRTALSYVGPGTSWRLEPAGVATARLAPEKEGAGENIVLRLFREADDKHTNMSAVSSPLKGPVESNRDLNVAPDMKQQQTTGTEEEEKMERFFREADDNNKNTSAVSSPLQGPVESNDEFDVAPDMKQQETTGTEGEEKDSFFREADDNRTNTNTAISPFKESVESNHDCDVAPDMKQQKTTGTKGEEKKECFFREADENNTNTSIVSSPLKGPIESAGDSTETEGEEKERFFGEADDNITNTSAVSSPLKGPKEPDDDFDVAPERKQQKTTETEGEEKKEDAFDRRRSRRDRSSSKFVSYAEDDFIKDIDIQEVDADMPLEGASMDPSTNAGTNTDTNTCVNTDTSSGVDTEMKPNVNSLIKIEKIKDKNKEKRRVLPDDPNYLEEHPDLPRDPNNPLMLLKPKKGEKKGVVLCRFGGCMKSVQMPRPAGVCRAHYVEFLDDSPSPKKRKAVKNEPGRKRNGTSKTKIITCIEVIELENHERKRDHAKKSTKENGRKQSKQKGNTCLAQDCSKEEVEVDTEEALNPPPTKPKKKLKKNGEKQSSKRDNNCLTQDCSKEEIEVDTLNPPLTEPKKKLKKNGKKQSKKRDNNCLTENCSKEEVEVDTLNPPPSEPKKKLKKNGKKQYKKRDNNCLTQDSFLALNPPPTEDRDSRVLDRKRRIEKSKAKEDKQRAEELIAKEAAENEPELNEDPEIEPERVKFQLVEDPNTFYVEEEAHLYHNPPIPSLDTEGVEPEHLLPIPPPEDLPEFPNTGKCKWLFDKIQRVLFVDFSACHQGNRLVMDPKDEDFFLKMMERNDVTIISEGFVSLKALDSSMWTMDYMRSVLGQEYYHKFRRFDTIKDEEGLENCCEIDEMYSMRIADYVKYFLRRREVIENQSVDTSFSFVDHEQKNQTIANVEISAIYMIDLDINKLLPKLYSNFMESFVYPGVLPGGSHCMMNSVTSNARPFMGPNLYVTPPASFTHFHQDGHGTVDSGHLCLNGYNEVIMLRRLTERHKKNALILLTGVGNGNAKSKNKYFDGLYQLPHADQLGEKPAWPTHERIEQCRKMGYCPTVCVVKPGQFIHINKGRLHAFRKMSIAPLPADDCHKQAREGLIRDKNMNKEQICISVAWDWMFRGVTPAGINREVASVVEAAILNRKNGKMSLAIPEMSLLQMAKVVPSSCEEVIPAHLGNLIGFGEKCNNEDMRESTNAADICRGILPSFRHVVEQHFSAMDLVSEKNTKERGERVTLAKRPNSHENPQKFPVDPYGNSDFICKLCSQELSNIYFHCDGCEQLMSKDFNICIQCHSEKSYMHNFQMHPMNPKKHSTINHTGGFHFDRHSRCPCKNGPVCRFCDWCAGCSCRCHTWFTLHRRLHDKEEEEILLDNVIKRANSGSSQPNKYLDDPIFTQGRFEVASRKFD